MDNIRQIMDTFIDEAVFIFKFNVTTGIVEQDIVDKLGYNYMKSLGLKSPCKFDDLIGRSWDLGYTNIVYNLGTSPRHVYCKDLLKFYENGQNYVETCFYNPEKCRYYRLVYILKKDITDDIFAYVICVDVTDIDRMYLKALAESFRSMKQQDNVLTDNLKILNSMAKFYLYIYSCDMETEIYKEIYYAGNHIHAIVGETGNINIATRDLCRMLVKPEYVTAITEFLDISTLKERLDNKQYITQQFEGNFTGWLEVVAFPGEVTESGSFEQVIFAIRDINYEKEKENKLIYNSYVDDLTKLYNRKMYNENLAEYNSLPLQKNLVVLSVDVNGLKAVNDTLGHDAGDELLTGVAQCLRDNFSQYGRIYRLGGDEYTAIIYISPANLPKLIKQFDDTVNNWRGKLVDKVSISLGYVTKSECEGKNIYEMMKIADQRMYKSKEEYYAQKGVDRIGRQTAYAALCSIYEKVLKINLTTNTYQIIHIDEKEFHQVNSLNYTLSEDLARYREIGRIHPGDAEKFREMMDIEKIREFFRKGNKRYTLSYKRKVNGQFRVAKLELVPAEDYSHDNQALFLFVRCGRK